MGVFEVRSICHGKYTKLHAADKHRMAANTEQFAPSEAGVLRAAAP